jgi:hypothetical protein
MDCEDHQGCDRVSFYFYPLFPPSGPWANCLTRLCFSVTPNTFRPPYGDIDDRIRAIGLAMGFTPVIWTGNNGVSFDTNDWHVAAGTVSASGVLAAFENILSQASQLNTGFIVLAHDLYQQSVDLATGYILPDALARTNPAFKLMSIIECLGQPLSDAYKETNNNSTNPPPSGISQSPAAGSTTTSTRSGAERTTMSSSLVGALVAAMVLPALGLLL